MSIRLIDTFTLSLKSFLGDIPPYAILSHTWKDEEISFQDMLAIENDPHHPASERSGYAKVVVTCQQASQRGIGYAWVDTCCIDKTSSSELSEIINSMYQWYWNAEICFALLADLADTTALEIALPKCRWFTRGWCLQELIAPNAVEFYDSKWNCIGVKVDLTALLSSITHIDEQVLVERSQVEKVPVGHRMSWAAKRKTTRLEDIAYCLLGIFNVHMPILYGEAQGHSCVCRRKSSRPRTTSHTADELRPDAPSETHTKIEEAYIIAIMSPSAQLYLESCGGYAVLVTSHAYRLSKALQVFRRVP